MLGKGSLVRRWQEGLFFCPAIAYVWAMKEGWAKDFHFNVDKPASNGWTTNAAPSASPWTAPPSKPKYADDENLKKQFGVEWAKCEKPFEAACKVFETDTSAALWIASNWLTDPLVVAAKDVYLKEVTAKSALLDKDDFAAMLMMTVKNGKLKDKELINILKLYADVRGFLNKDTATINNFNNNEGLKVVFVKAEPQPIPTIAPVTVSNDKSEILNEVPSPIKIKLVSNG